MNQFGWFALKRNSLSSTMFICRSQFRRFSANFNVFMGDGAHKTLELYNTIPIDKIRNFCIIAHVDHGKSTLADRLLLLLKCIPENSPSQVLDNLEIERERGITVKAQTASMIYNDPRTKLNYLLNLIDTPGHVDFTYEVNRSIIACEGSLLLVDSTQGVQAQTIANHKLALKHNLVQIPILTKIDMNDADPERCINQIEKILKIKTDNILLVSAKTGDYCSDIFPAIVDNIPPPKGSANNKFRARIFDSWYETYNGVVFLIQIFDGMINKGDTIYCMNHKKELEVYDLGLVLPVRHPVNTLSTGQIGYIITRSKETELLWVGDTFVHLQDVNSGVRPLPGFTQSKHMIFSSVYPTDQDSFDKLYSAVKKLLLTDSSVSVIKEHSDSLGTGLRCGFLGVLHKDIFYERLQREFDTDVIITAPCVPYTVKLKSTGLMKTIEKPSELPPSNEVDFYLEPMANVDIITPVQYLRDIQLILDQKRGTLQSLIYIDSTDVMIKYLLPYNELIQNFYENILAVSSGYATINYESAEPQQSDITKVNILLNSNVVDPLSFICHRDKADPLGRSLVEKLGKVIPRQQYEVIIQASIGSKIIAALRKAPFRKNILEKSGKVVGGGDQQRKMKLLKQQREGKKKLKQIGNIDVPHEAFLAILSK